MPGTKAWVPLITPQRFTPSVSLPGVGRAEDAGARADAGVVHQDVGAAPALGDRRLAAPSSSSSAADVGLHRHDRLVAAGRRSRDAGGGRGQPIGPEIGDADAQAQPRRSGVAAARPMPEAPPVTTATASGVRAGWGMGGLLGLGVRAGVCCCTNHHAPASATWKSGAGRTTLPARPASAITRGWTRPRSFPRW